MSEEEASPVEKTAAGDGSSDGTAIGNGAAERALAVKGNGCEVTTSEGGEAKGDADKASDGGAPTGGLAQTFDLFSFASMFRYTDRADALLMAIGTVGALANGMGLPLFSLIFGDLLDSLNDTLDVRSAVDDKVKWLGILAGGTLVAGWAQIAFWTLAGERLMGHVREEYLKAALRQDARYYDVVSPPGDTFAALGPDVASMTEAVGQNVGLAIQYVTTFIAGLIIGFIRGWRVALVVLAFIPLFILVLAVLGTVLMGAAKKSSEAYASAASIANNALCSIREVLSATAHEFLNASYNDALAPAVRSDRTEGITRGAIWGGFFFLMFATYGSVLWIAAVFVRDGHMSGGEVVTAFFAVMIGGIILGQLAPIASSMLGGIPAARRLYALIDRTPDIDVYGPGETPQEVAAELKLTDVRFAYPARPDYEVLRGISLEVPPGQTVALVGESGSGKSTVIQLIERFYDPTSGVVMLDGVDLRQLQVRWLRQQMGLVSQEPILFSGSVRENIRFGRPDASDEEVEAAARAANAHTFVEAMDNGYDTFCGERGTQLSGGQKQRLAIARALLRDPRILLLDEATSALDAESENLVQRALETLMVNRTTLLVAHRLSTVRNADNIFVLARGQVIEKGSHSSLVSTSGSAYASLVQLQQVMFSDSERTFSEPSKAGSKYDVDAPNAKKGDHDASVDASLKSIAVVPSLATDPDQEDVTRGRASSGNGVSPQAADAPVSTPVGNGGASSELRPTSTDNDAASAAAADDAGPRYSLVRFVLPEWKYGLVGFVAAGCIGAAFPVFGLLLSEAINVYYLPDSSQMVSEAAKWGGILIGLGGGLFIAASMANGATGIGGGRLTMRVRKEVFAHMLRQEVSWFDTHQTAEMASQLEADAKAVQVLAGQRVGILIQGLVTLVVGMVLALTAGWQLALVVMALFPLLGFAGYLEMQTMGKNLMDNKGAGKTLDDFAAEEAGEREAAHGMATSAGRPGLVASEAILNVRTVASSTAEESIAIAYRSALSGPRRAAYRNAQIAGGGYGLCYAIIFGAYALAFWYGGVLVDEGKLTFQQVLEVFFALVISATTIAQSQALLPDWAKTDAAVKNIFELLNRRSKIDPESSFGLAITDRDDMRGSLQLRDVRFAYPARPDYEVLRGISLEVPPGQTVALVGESGSGKSTVIQLIERFYDPTSGVVMLDGVDLRQLQVRWLRQQMGLVSQEPILFSGSVRENIRFGRPDASDEEVEAAARAANAHTFVEAMDNGYDTFCGERGTQLSGGQKQRLAIARALLRDPRILLLDEATSALDAESENLVQRALETLMVNRTTLLVAHRLSTVRNADEIIVMARGEALETGTHDQLMETGGAYAALVRLQMS